jgi:hypothetical protein
MATTTTRQPKPRQTAQRKQPVQIASGGTKTIRMEKAKETKGTFRYENYDDTAFTSTLYVRKSAFKNGNVPDSIEVTIKF